MPLMTIRTSIHSDIRRWIIFSIFFRRMMILTCISQNFTIQRSIIPRMMIIMMRMIPRIFTTKRMVLAHDYTTTAAQPYVFKLRGVSLLGMKLVMTILMKYGFTVTADKSTMFIYYLLGWRRWCRWITVCVPWMVVTVLLLWSLWITLSSAF